MWKLCKKRIFSKWSIRRYGYKCRNSKVKSVQSSLLCSSDNNGNSDDGNHEKQQARKQNGFWDDHQFHCYSINSTFFQTIGWLSTAVAFGINNKHHIFKNSRFDGERGILQSYLGCRQIYPNVTSMFYKLALAMPKSTAKNVLPVGPALHGVKKEVTDDSSCEEVPSIDETLTKLQAAVGAYIAESENISGLALLDKDSHKSFHFFKSSAEHGCSKALFNLGLCYELGKGTTVHLKKAAECYTKASHKGHDYASYNLGIFHLQGLGGLPQNSEIGLKLLKKAADLGVSKAQVYLGLEYLEEEKFCDAFSMFNKSALQNNVEGVYYLGMCYENGWGVIQNEKMAAEMYAQAAANGHQDALFNLGLYNEQGRGGLSKNVAFAMALYQIIADMGHNEAREALCILKTKKSNSICDSNAQHTSNSTSHKISTSTNNGGLHGSSSSPDLSSINLSSLSSPELHSFKFSKPPNAVPYYLDLMIPASPISQMCN